VPDAILTLLQRAIRKRINKAVLQTSTWQTVKQTTGAVIEDVVATKDDILKFKKQKDINYAKNQLLAKGITEDDPAYDAEFAEQYKTAKEQSDAIWGLALGEGAGDLVSAFVKLKAFKYTSSAIEGSSNIPIQIGSFTTKETSQLAATQAERIAAQEAAQAAGNTGWIDEVGNIKWPKNDGFAATPKHVTLQTGAKIDRYGYENGSFVAPQGISYESRALAPGTETKPYKVYEVVKPIEALGGETAPWFNQPGGGIQFKLSKTIQELLDGGYIRKVEP